MNQVVKCISVDEPIQSPENASQQWSRHRGDSSAPNSQGLLQQSSDLRYDRRNAHPFRYGPVTKVVSTQTDPWPVYREPRGGPMPVPPSAQGHPDLRPAISVSWRTEQRPDFLATAKSPPPVVGQDTSGGIIVKGTMTCTVTDISDLASPPIYRTGQSSPLVTNTWDGARFWNAARNRWEYQQSMTVIRSSDI